MRTGASISAAAHTALIALMVFGGPVFDRKKKETRLQVTDVTLVTAAELDAVASRAPQAPRTDTDTPIPPRIENADPQTPAADVSPATEPSPEQPVPTVETPPDLASVATPPGITAIANSETLETPEAPSEPIGLNGVSPVAVAGQDVPPSPDTLAPAEPPKPVDAPRVDTTAAPKPPTDAVRADTERPEIVAEEMSIEPEDERPAEAPDQATPEIPLEPVDIEPQSAAPLAAIRPRGRPSNLAQNTAQSATAPSADAGETGTPEQPADNTQTGTSASTLPAGPPLTGGDIDGLRLSIKQCWAVPAGLRNAEELEVVVGVTLSQSGKVVGNNVRWLEPSDQSDARFRAAFRAARSAIIRCQPYDMPREKYAQWKDLEVVFNPEGMKGLW